MFLMKKRGLIRTKKDYSKVFKGVHAKGGTHGKREVGMWSGLSLGK